jgi:hypothetical protein
MTPEELKARLLAEAEAIINEIVGQDEASQAKTLDEIEQVALRAGQQIKTSVRAGLVGNAPSASVGKACRQGGGKLKAKGKRSKWVLTQAGEVQMERDYYYCDQCKTGFFPQ